MVILKKEIPGILTRLMTLILTVTAVAFVHAQSDPGTTAKAVAEKESESSPVGEVFLLIPDSDLDLLTTRTKSDMIIYMQADSIYKARNIYAGLSWIEKMTPDYMKVHLTDVSSLQIKMLDSSKMNGRLAMTIYTVAGESDTADSTIKFYLLTGSAGEEQTLTELPAKKFFSIPDPKCFYDMKDAPKDITLGSLLRDMPFHTIAYDIAPSTDILTGRLTISNYLTLEQRRKIDPCIRPELKWKWNGKSFRMIKE